MPRNFGDHFMRFYELTYLISPELNPQELKDFSQKVDSLISKFGKVIKSEQPKKIKLAYPIQKKEEAFLTTFEFEAEPEKADNLKKELQNESKIMRFLLIKKKKIEKAKKELKPKKEKPEPEKKVELKEIEEKLERILKE